MFKTEEENQNIKDKSPLKKIQVNDIHKNKENNKDKFLIKQEDKKLYIIYRIIILLIIVIFYLYFNNKETSEELIQKLKLVNKKIEEIEKMIKTLKERGRENIKKDKKENKNNEIKNKKKNEFNSKKYWN